MRVVATRRLQFAIGHRVHGHEGKCAHLHGHNFILLLTAEREHEGLDGIGRVLDFGVLKDRLGGWIERSWDHGFLLWQEDKEAIEAMTWVHGQKYFLLPYNPTAENVGRYLLEVVGPQVLAGTGVRLVRAVVHETENGIAEVEL